MNKKYEKYDNYNVCPPNPSFSSRDGMWLFGEVVTIDVSAFSALKVSSSF